MTAKKSRNCKDCLITRARLRREAVTHDTVFHMVVDGVILGDTDLASYLFAPDLDCDGRDWHCDWSNGIWAIAQSAKSMTEARRMARQILRGVLPRGVLAYNDTTTEWLAGRAEVAAETKSETKSKTLDPTPADCVGHHMSSAIASHADWTDLWMRVNGDGIIIDTLGCDDSENFGLVAVEWIGDRLVLGDPDSHSDAYAHPSALNAGGAA